ncbi:MAG TPA: phage tail sheath subtilisin-like domain-containing protein [Caulobacteraceae bacterium]
MSVSYTFPGIYVQELPSSSHSVSPAPTSVAAFVGYSHPYKTGQFGVAKQLFSFTDYETYFGGLFSSGVVDASLPRAVYQFFLNGGSTAWVVGLQSSLWGLKTGVAPKLLATLGTGAGDIQPTLTVPTAGPAGSGMVFSALEPIDAVQMNVTLTNFRGSSGPNYPVFDIIITYGAHLETYRGVTLGAGVGAAINGVSALVTVAAGTGGWGTGYKAPYTAPTWSDVTSGLIGFSTAYSPDDYLPVFQANSSLDNVEIFNLLMTPGNVDNLVVSAALSFAERKRAFSIVDPPPQAPAFQYPPPATTPPQPQPIDNWMTGLTGGTYELPTSQNGALYFPYLESTDPVTDHNIPMAPCGWVAGAYADTDASRGVWKAPAGLATSLLNTTGPVSSGVMNDQQQGVLNHDAINCLRAFSGEGTVVWGARTLVAANTAYEQWKYVPVRRMALFIEQSLVGSLKWVVFEPNDEPLWIAITQEVSAFMLSLFRQGAFQGAQPSDAFQVKCDATTTTPSDQALGVVNIVVAFAPLKPAEFVVIKIAQLAGQTAGS